MALRTAESMRYNHIRFHRMIYNWMKETVYIKYIVGSQEKGGYENEVEITFEIFETLVDTTKLQEYLTQKN